jgi:hypothetical protein
MSSKETRSESLAAEKMKEGLPMEHLSKEVIEYLSKEIATTTTNMMVYRTKIAFAVYLGPFIILIAVVTKGVTFSLRLDSIAIAAIFINFLCFLTLAYMNARVERQAWLQCNKWRAVIARLHNNPSMDLTRDDLFDNLYGDDPNDRLFKKWTSQLAYIATYAVLVVSFIMSIVIIARFRAPESPTPSATNASNPTQK